MTQIPWEPPAPQAPPGEAGTGAANSPGHASKGNGRLCTRVFSLTARYTHKKIKPCIHMQIRTLVHEVSFRRAKRWKPQVSEDR